MGQANRRRQEAEMRHQGRLPPGQIFTSKFPVFTCEPVTPTFDPQTWDFRAFGEIDRPLVWTWGEFLRLPTVTITTDIHCVTRWSKFDTTWEGVPFRHLAELVGMRDATRHIIAHCQGGYTTNVPVEDMLRENVLLAYKYNGDWLEPDHGAPLRTLIPHLYLWKSAKFLRALEFSSVDKPGFWEVRGYHNHGDPLKEERYG